MCIVSVVTVQRFRWWSLNVQIFCYTTGLCGGMPALPGIHQDLGLRPFFHEFFSNAPYKFTQLTNLRHLIFALGLFGWRIPFIEVFFWWEYFFFILAFSYTPIFLGTHVGSRTRPWYTVVEHCWDQKRIPGGSGCVTMRCNSIETPTLYIHDSS